jgi:outer membrane receptor protein involved in Fe transport
MGNALPVRQGPGRAFVARLCAVVVAWAVLLESPALAQAPPPASSSAGSKSEPERLPEVLVTAPSRLPGDPLPLSRVPATVDIVPGDRLRSTGAATLQEALTRLPGVNLTDQQGNSQQMDFSFRGFRASPVTGESQGLSVFVDGVRVNEPTVEEVNFDLLPLDDIERIEVIRGPAAGFGRNTLGGVLNIITRRGASGWEIVPEIAGGSFGRQKYRLQAGGAAGPFDAYAAGSLFKEEGWRDASEVRVAKFFGRVGLKFDGTDLSLSYQRADNRIEQPGSLPSTELRRDRTLNYTGGDFFAPTVNLATLSVRQSLSPELALSMTGFGRWLDAEQFNVNQIGANTRSFTGTTSAGGTIQLGYDGALFGHANHLVVGAEYAHSDVRLRVFDEVMGDRELESLVSDNQNAVGVYAQDTLNLATDLLRPADRLVMSVAVRWDWLRHDIDDASPPTARPDASGVSTFSRPNPAIGFNYNLSRDWGFYFNYSEGFRAPAFLELTCAGPGAICPGLQAGVAPDPPLKAVTARNYEVGMRARPTPWLDAALAFYRTDVSDDIYSVSPTGTTGVFFQNVGDTRRQGIEVALGARPLEGLETRLSYAYTDATFQDDLILATPRLTPGCAAAPCSQLVRRGSEYPLVPRHRIDLRGDYRPTSWLTLWLGGSYVGSQRLRGDEANVERTLNDYFVVDAGLRAAWKGFTGFVTINNLLNNHYETFGTFAPNAKLPGAPVESFLTPSAPINVLAGVAYKF